MLLSLALSALTFAPQAPQAQTRPLVVPAGLEAPAAPARTSLAERIAEARRRAAPAKVSVPDLREQARVAAMYPERPCDGLGSSTRRVALGQTAQIVRNDERLGSEARRAFLSAPQLPRKAPRRR